MCLGRSDLCDLRYDQVTLAGTHNSGSGFNGNLRLSSGVEALPCVYRNQNMSYTEQLNFGIRFFDIDLCWVTEAEATPSISAGLWTCHSNGYAGRIEEVLNQVNDWMDGRNNSQIVSLNFNGDYDRSRSQPIAEALHNLLESMWWTTPIPPQAALRMNSDFNETGQWPTIYAATSTNRRVFVFLHETLQLGGKPWAHDPINGTLPNEVVNDNCNGLIDHTRGACNVCTDLFMVDAYGGRGHCVFEIAGICNQVTANVSRACFDQRMTYGKTVNVVLVDFPDAAPNSDSVVKVVDMLNDLNVAFYASPPPDLPNVTDCFPGYTPTPSPTPLPQPTTYCEALRQLAQTPVYYFQCHTNEACDRLVCPTDLLAIGAPFQIEFALIITCNDSQQYEFELTIKDPLGRVVGNVMTNTTGQFLVLAIPLNITLDPLENAVGVMVCVS